MKFRIFNSKLNQLINLNMIKRIGSLLTLKDREPSWDYRESNINNKIIKIML